MKLFYSPGACSLAPHIVLQEIGQEFDIVRVDLATKLTEYGDDYKQTNSKGSVPALMLDNDELLTEAVAIMQYLADQSPETGLVPSNGTLERARLYESLNYLTAELHKAFVPLFTESTDAEKQKAVLNIQSKLNYCDSLLSSQDYLLQNQFSLADIYLFVILSWTAYVGIDLDQWTNLAAFSQRIAGRESVQKAMRAEGLISE